MLLLTNVMMQMWQAVAAAVMVVTLPHRALADVIVLTANHTPIVFADAPASFGPPIPLEGFKVRPRHFPYIVISVTVNNENKVK